MKEILENFEENSVIVSWKFLNSHMESSESRKMVNGTSKKLKSNVIAFFFIKFFRLLRRRHFLFYAILFQIKLVIWFFPPEKFLKFLVFVSRKRFSWIWLNMKRNAFWRFAKFFFRSFFLSKIFRRIFRTRKKKFNFSWLQSQFIERKEKILKKVWNNSFKIDKNHKNYKNVL